MRTSNPTYQIIANWKNRPDTIEQAKQWFREYQKLARKHPHIDFKLLAPVLAVPVLARMKMPENLSLLTHGFFSNEETNDWSLGSLHLACDVGIKHVMVGHRDTHHLCLNNSQEFITKQLEQAITNRIPVIACFGERERDEDGCYLKELEQQLQNIIEPFMTQRGSLQLLTLAYEPQWAAGEVGAQALVSDEIFAVILLTRNILSSYMSERRAKQIPFVYGGALDETSAEQIVTTPGLSGMVLGRSSTQTKVLQKIVSVIDQA